MRTRIGVLAVALLAVACDDGGDAVESGRLELVAVDIETIEQVRVLVRREAGADAGAGTSETQESTVTVSEGLLTERPLVVSGNLLPPGEGRITVHAVALVGGAVVGVGDGSALPEDVKTITIAPVPADCDQDGDTWLDCRNLRAGCCGAVAPEDKDRATDCHDDPNIDPPNPPDAKQRLASAAHPFGSESSSDYRLCQNGLDEDCTGGDVRCDDVDGDDDGSPLAEDCDDADPLTNPGAIDGPDPEDRDCDGDPGGVVGTDADQDGYSPDAEDLAERDCDDDDARRNPGAVEVPCNDVDEDCDGTDPCAMDDLDGDGFAVPEDCDGFDAGVFPGAPERCGDGVDQDCDGEDLACAPDDLDRDGFGADDCADDDPTQYPGAPERCGDGVDQDCNGADLECPPGADADGDGFLTPADCDDDAPRVFPGQAERCNRVDDDCDGLVDEGNPRIEADGVGRRPPTCSVDLGLCSEGPLVCTENPDDPARAIFVCLGVLGDVETCDGLDNDCDGEVDNPPPGADTLPDEAVQPCGPEQMRGVCRAGTLFCEDGALVDCQGATEPSAEDCNGLDDDCDGRTDEGLAGGVLTATCFDGPEERAAQGICRPGVRTCEDGQFTACVSQIVPEEEGCNGLDDDCDGQTDELEPVPCYNHPPETQGVGVCRAGSRACVDGALGPCDGQVGPSAELCDALDNDCDGRVDQVQQQCFSGAPGQIGVGVCRAGVGTCRDGAFSDCAGERPPAAEACDQLDNDCDGATDEAFNLTSDPDNCGVCGRACEAGQACCAGACRALDTVQNCGGCGVVCGDEADRCSGAGGAAACGCGDGPACEGGLRCLGDGTCGCEQDLDCGAERLCCDGACVETSVDRCTDCAGGACAPDQANACGGRRCLCGDTGACPVGTQCALQDGSFACVGCVDNSACPGDSICCGQVCVATNADNQCTDCGVPCDTDVANVCNGEDGQAARTCGCGDGPACAGDERCVVDAPVAFCAECRDADDCPGARPFCLDNVCRACDPAGHAGCANNQLCCGFTCQDTGVGNRACESCEDRCDPAATDRCTNRGCQCGNADPCAGATPFCVEGACEACRGDGDCGGETPYCAGGVCVECRVGTHVGCAGSELCCAQGGTPQCQSTNASPAGQCEACDVGCDADGADRCTNRGCACGGGDACDPAGDTPVCADGGCVECADNVDCNGRDGNFCVDNQCVDCDPDGHAGCGADQLCCAGGGGFSCVGTSPEGSCTACGAGCNEDFADTCTDRGCRCGVNAPCAGGDFCVAGQCVACRDEVDCGADQLCCNGACTDQGFGGGAICEACGQACDEGAADRCADGSCRCGDNPPCAGDTPECVDGDCVECTQNLDCPNESPICEGNRCRPCEVADADPACAACAVDADCAENGEGEFCVDGRCVPCLRSGDGCEWETDAAICGEDPILCRGCASSPECVARIELEVQRCGNDQGCRNAVGRLDLCITTGERAGECLECDARDQTGCGGKRPICADTYACRRCQNDDDCAAFGLPDNCQNDGRCRD